VIEDLASSGIAVTSVAFSVAATALFVLVRLARRTGLVDDGRDAPERKTQARAVPLAGGPALFVAGLVLVALESSTHTWSLANLAPSDSGAIFRFERGALTLALLLAFATGLVDDLAPRGLTPLPKLLGQFAAGCALATGLVVDGEPTSFFERAFVALLAVIAQNVANTFDHADGTLGSLAFVGCLGARAPFAGAIAAFLGANLARPARGGPPYAYLGDSGSHVLGILLLATPAGQAALTLPAIDLVRVVWMRVRAGDPIWRGDRRHLGQRLAAAGRSPTRVVLLVLVCAAPAFLAFFAADVHGGMGRLAAFGLGAACSALVLGLVLRLHPAPSAA